MKWQRVWRRSFATEDEADVFYERLQREFDEGECLGIAEPHRFSGTIVEVGFGPSTEKDLERVARAIEVSYSPLDSATPCVCGHRAGRHDAHDKQHDHPCRACSCSAFERADWPGEELL